MVKKIIIGGGFLVGGILFLKFILDKNDENEINKNTDLTNDFNLSKVNLDDINFNRQSKKIKALEECKKKHQTIAGGLQEYIKIGDCMVEKGFLEEKVTIDLTGTRQDGLSVFTPNWII